MQYPSNSGPKHIQYYLAKPSNKLQKNYKFGKFNPEKLPIPKSYYQLEFPGIVLNSIWVNVLCCFHEDNKASLSINMIEGHFKCHACNVKGGDIIHFHKLKYQLNFIEAAKDLGAWEVI